MEVFSEKENKGLPYPATVQENDVSCMDTDKAYAFCLARLATPMYSD